MTEDLTDGAFAILELLAIPVLVPVALGLALWRWLRRPKPWVGTVAPTAHRGAELGRLAEDHLKPRVIKKEAYRDPMCPPGIVVIDPALHDPGCEQFNMDAHLKRVAWGWMAPWWDLASLNDHAGIGEGSL